MSGPKFTMDLELGKLREFARATSAPSDPYLVGDHPPITPTFLTTSRLWEEDNPWSKLGFSAQRVLHAEQEYVFHGEPPRVGTRLQAESTIEKVFTKDGRRGRMTFAVMVTRFHDNRGRLVAEARMTGVEMPPPTPQSHESRSTAGSESSPRAAAPSDATPVIAEEHSSRTPLAPRAALHGPLTITDFVRYQGASGDMNPLHHDPATAKLAGFEVPVSVGMLQAGLLASYAVRWLGAEKIRTFRVRFQAPVFAGDVITCQPAGRITAGDGTLEAHLSCTRQTGSLAAEAWALFSDEPDPATG